MSDNASRIPKLADVLRAWKEADQEETHVGKIVSVESYDATTQKVNVQPLIKEAFTDEAGERQIERLPVITNVPVQFPQGGGYRLTFPIQRGDTGLLLFSDNSLDVWLSQGGEVDPIDDRRFDLSDGIFLPGVRSFKAPITDASADHMSIGKEGGLQIHIDATKIKIGSSTGAENEAAALGDTLTTYIGLLHAWNILVAAALTALIPGPPFAPPPTPPVLISTTVEVKK